jgi:tetratricopeptide (TPR) repeat protein
VHSALAVALIFRASYNLRLPASVRDDGLQEAIVAQRLDPSLAEPYFVRAFVACQRNQWEPCVSLMREADMRGMKTPPLANPAVVLARLGYLDRAEDLAREIVARDPLNKSAHFTLGRVLDTMGRHEEAKADFAPSRHSLDFNRYGHWFNAYWRKDYADAGELIQDGLGADDANWSKLKPGYVAMMRALAGQGSWADVEAENRKFEQETGLFALLRVLQPDARSRAPELIAGLERMRKGSYSTWDLVLWEKEYAFLRRDPAFQDYLRRNGILDYWRKNGFPKQCRPQGEGADCA